MTYDEIAEGLRLVVERLANDTPPTPDWAPEAWAYVKGIASAQVMFTIDRLRAAAMRGLGTADHE